MHCFRRLQAILEKLGNDVIYSALQFVNGRQILRSDPEDVEERLHLTIHLFGLLRGTYLHYKEKSLSTEHPWQLQDELVFNLPDQFVERCYDMIDLVQMSASFGQLSDVQVGGDIRMARSVDQINSEFREALKRIEGTGYDLLDIAAKKYDDDFFAFRRSVNPVLILPYPLPPLLYPYFLSVCVLPFPPPRCLSLLHQSSPFPPFPLSSFCTCSALPPLSHLVAPLQATFNSTASAVCCPILPSHGNVYGLCGDSEA